MATGIRIDKHGEIPYAQICYGWTLLTTPIFKNIGITINSNIVSTANRICWIIFIDCNDDGTANYGTTKIIAEVHTYNLSNYQISIMRGKEDWKRTQVCKTSINEQTYKLLTRNLSDYFDIYIKDMKIESIELTHEETFSKAQRVITKDKLMLTT